MKSSSGNTKRAHGSGESAVCVCVWGGHLHGAEGAARVPAASKESLCSSVLSSPLLHCLQPWVRVSSALVSCYVADGKLSMASGSWTTRALRGCTHTARASSTDDCNSNSRGSDNPYLNTPGMAHDHACRQNIHTYTITWVLRIKLRFSGEKN